MSTETAKAAPAGDRVRFRVIGQEDGLMLRQLLARRLGMAQPAVALLLKAGGVYLGSVRTCLGTLRVHEGERVTVYRGAAAAAPVDPDAVRVVHRDAHCIIVDKPHGVPAAATREASRGAISHALVQRLARDGVLRPYVGLVFPLDPAAAGLAVFTARGQDTASFFREFAELDAQLVYRARLSGHVSFDIECDAPLVRATGGALRLARETDRATLPARTVFRPLAAADGTTLVEVALQRGGADQLALHAATLGHPVVGEPGVGRVLELACVRVRFTQPLTGVAIDVTAELPPWADPAPAG